MDMQRMSRRVCNLHYGVAPQTAVEWGRTEAMQLDRQVRRSELEIEVFAGQATTGLWLNCGDRSVHFVAKISTTF